MKNQDKILILSNFYLPAFKGGGPIRSLSNMVTWLDDKYKFKVFTLNKDLNSKSAFENVKSNQWVKIKNRSEDVFYINFKRKRIRTIIKAFQEQKDYKIVYINSVFSLWFSIIPLIILKFYMKFPSNKILIFPRGELSSGAMEKSKFKKRIFLLVAKLIGLYKNVNWQATNMMEKEEINKIFKPNPNKIFTASNLPAKGEINLSKNIDKEKGKIKIVFLSRIASKKNLDYALNTLSDIESIFIEFDIYGEIDDVAYWNRCKKIIATFHSNIKVKYKGAIKHENVLNVLSNYHLFFFPTKGENYGHVINEALMAKTPVLISDRTPWLDLEKNKVGWSLPLSNQKVFKSIIVNMGNLNNEEYMDILKQVEIYSKSKLTHVKSLEQTEKMLNQIMQ